MFRFVPRALICDCRTADPTAVAIPVSPDPSPWNEVAVIIPPATKPDAPTTSVVKPTSFVNTDNTDGVLVKLL